MCSLVMVFFKNIPFTLKRFHTEPVAVKEKVTTNKVPVMPKTRILTYDVSSLQTFKNFHLLQKFYILLNLLKLYIDLRCYTKQTVYHKSNLAAYKILFL
jgi:hypothetical protein